MVVVIVVDGSEFIHEYVRIFPFFLPLALRWLPSMMDKRAVV